MPVHVESPVEVVQVADGEWLARDRTLPLGHPGRILGHVTSTGSGFRLRLARDHDAVLDFSSWDAAMLALRARPLLAAG